jgi:hypothetical protein
VQHLDAVPRRQVPHQDALFKGLVARHALHGQRRSMVGDGAVAVAASFGCRHHVRD